MLMGLANANRCSDLAALDLNYRTFQRGGVRFIIPGLTKTGRSGPPIEAFYPAFPEDRKVGPVHTLIMRLDQSPFEDAQVGSQDMPFLSTQASKPATLGQ